MNLRDNLLAFFTLDEGSIEIINTAVNAAVEFYGDYCTHLHENNSENVHGETQKRLDLQADEVFTRYFLNVDSVGLICSEEQDDPVCKSGTHAVCFDPLDGSSVIESNFATGSVFSVYATTKLIGLTPRSQTCSFYFIYGPNLVMTISDGKSVYTAKFNGFEFEFIKLDNLTKNSVLAPGNFKLIIDQDYVNKLTKVTKQGLALRYSGALVSDVHMLFIRSGGLFLRPVENSKKPKLRLLYECAPLALISEALGGCAVSSDSDILDITISGYHQTTEIFLGNKDLVSLWFE